MPTCCFSFRKTTLFVVALFALALTVASCGGSDGGDGELNDVVDLQPSSGSDETDEPTRDAVASDAAANDTPGVGSTDSAQEFTVGTYSTVADFLESDDAVTLSRGLRDRLILLTGCRADLPSDAIETHDEFVAAIVAAIPDTTASVALQSAIGHIDDADAVCGTDTVAWTAAMRRSLADLGTAESALGDPPASALDIGPHPNDASDPRYVSTDLAAINDRLNATLSGRNPIQASNVWYSSAHLAHARGLHALTVEGTPPEAIIIGDSTAAFLAPPQALSEQAGFSIANLGIDGSRLGTHIATVDQFLELSPGTQTVIWPLTTLMFFRDCPIAVDAAVANIAVQQQAFAPIPELTALTPLERLLGGTDPNGPIYGGTTLNEDATTRYPEGWVYGARQEVNVEVNPEGERLQVDRWASTFNDPQICEAEFAALEAKARELRDSNRRVVLVAGPLSNDLTDLHRGGRAAHDEVVARMGQAANNAGAEFIDLSGTVTEDQFRDLTHVNTSGAETTVALLAQALVVPS